MVLKDYKANVAEVIEEIKAEQKRTERFLAKISGILKKKKSKRSRINNLS